MLWKETGSAEQKISIPHPLSQTSYHNFVKLIISHLHAACNYRPFIGDHGDARGRTCPRQTHEVLAADVAGEQGGAHLWRSTDHVLKCLFTAQWIFDLQKKKDLIEINVCTCVIKRYHPDNHHDLLLQYRKQIARFSRAMVIRRNFFGINTLVS